MRRKDRGYPTLKFRQTIWQQLAVPVGGLVGIIMVELLFWITQGGFDVHEVQGEAGDWIPVAVVIGLIGRVPVTLTPSGLSNRIGRKRAILWSDVRAIQIEKGSFGSRNVVIYEFSGRRTRLRAPITGPVFGDRRFEEKYHAIGSWYLEHQMIPPGSAEPEDTPPPGYPIDDAVPSTAGTPTDDVAY